MLSVFISLFVSGVLASTSGLLIASMFFRQHLHVVAVFFKSLALLDRLNLALEQNRVGIIEKKRSAWRANAGLALKVTVLFAGIFTASLALQWTAPSYFLRPMLSEFSEQAPKWRDLFVHNLQVGLGCLAVSLLYRAGGALLVISWNAIHWSKIILGGIFYGPLASKGVATQLAATFVMIPHLLTEATAYVLSGLVGVFLSKALMKYPLGSLMFFRICRASLILLVVSAALLGIAALTEASFAHSSLQRLLCL